MHNSRNQLTTSIVLMLVSSLALIASFYPQWHLWGIDSMRTWPIWVRFVMTGLVFISLTPIVAQKIATALAASLNTALKKKSTLLFAILLILAVSTFLLLTSNNHLSGDGYNILGNISSGKVFSPTEPLDYLTHYLVGQIFGGGAFGALQSYRICSYLAGILFLFGVYLFNREELDWLTALPILTTFAAMQFFFGYVESYTFSFVLMFLYLLSAARDFKSSQPSLQTLLLLLLAICFHLASCVLLPSLLYLIYRKYPTKRTKLILGTATILGGLIGVLYLCSVGVADNIFVPVIANSDNPYSLFSSAHLSDLLNLSLRNFPLLLVILVSSSFWRSEYLRLQLCSLIPALLFTILVDPKIGAVRDWDLLSIASAPVMVIVLFSIGESTIETKLYRIRLFLPLLLFGMLHTGSFISANHHKTSSYTYTKEVIRNDVHYAPSYFKGSRLVPWANLAFDEYNDPEEGFRAQKVRLNADPDDHLNRYNLAHNYAARGNYAEASALLTDHWQPFLGEVKTVTTVANTFMLAKNYAEAEQLLQTFAEENSDSYEILYNLGLLKALRGANDSAWYFLNKAVIANPKAPLANLLDYYLISFRANRSDVGISGLHAVADSLGPQASEIIANLIDAYERYDSLKFNTLAVELKRLAQIKVHQ